MWKTHPRKPIYADNALFSHDPPGYTCGLPCCSDKPLRIKTPHYGGCMPIPVRVIDDNFIFCRRQLIDNHLTFRRDNFSFSHFNNKPYQQKSLLECAGKLLTQDGLLIDQGARNPNDSTRMVKGDFGPRRNYDWGVSASGKCLTLPKRKPDLEERYVPFILPAQKCIKVENTDLSNGVYYEEIEENDSLPFADKKLMNNERGPKLTASAPAVGWHLNLNREFPSYFSSKPRFPDKNLQLFRRQNCGAATVPRQSAPVKESGSFKRVPFQKKIRRNDALWLPHGMPVKLMNTDFIQPWSWNKPIGVKKKPPPPPVLPRQKCKPIKMCPGQVRENQNSTMGKSQQRKFKTSENPLALKPLKFNARHNSIKDNPITLIL